MISSTQQTTSLELNAKILPFCQHIEAGAFTQGVNARRQNEYSRARSLAIFVIARDLLDKQTI